MKRLAALFLVLFTCTTFAVSSIKVTGTGGSPIPTTYDITGQSLVLKGLPSTLLHFCAFNDTASRVAFRLDHDSPAYAPTNDIRDVYIPAGTGVCFDNIAVMRQIFLRSDSGSTITSGSVYVHAW